MNDKDDKIDEINKLAKDIKQIFIQKEVLYIEAAILEKKIMDIKETILEIEKRLHLFICGDEKTKKTKNVSMPDKGIVIDIIDVMDEKNPMTIKEIIQAIENKGKKANINSVTSYLSNLECFLNTHKSNPLYNKKGWVCRKTLLKFQTTKKYLI